MILFLIIFGGVVVWLLSLLVHPFGRCWLCRGEGQIRRKGRRRAPKCPLCRGLAASARRLADRPPDPPPGSSSLARPAVRGTWQTTDGGGGGVVLVVVVAALAIGSGAASAITSAIVTVLIVIGSVIGRAAPAGSPCSSTGLARIAQDGRSPPGRSTSYLRNRGRNCRHPIRRRSAPAASFISTCTG